MWGAGRTARDRRQVSLKIPAKSATVLVSSDLQVRGLEMLCAYVKAELNLRQLHVQTADRNDTKLECTPDARMLGKRLGAKYKAVAAAIKTLPSLAVRQVRVLALPGQTLFWCSPVVCFLLSPGCVVMFSGGACMFHVRACSTCMLYVRASCMCVHQRLISPVRSRGNGSCVWVRVDLWSGAATRPRADVGGW